MPVVADQIELQTHDENKVLRLSLVEKSLHGDWCECQLFVRSHGFTCEKRFEFETPVEAIEALKRLDGGEIGEALIGRLDDAEFISLSHSGGGHVLVKGRLIDWREDSQTLQFAFKTDQTVIRPLIREFQAVVDA